MSIGLTKAMNGFFVPPGSGQSLDSSRNINAYNKICYNWNGLDSAGRQSSPNGFDSRSAGCNSALDDINTTNAQRPQYLELVNGGRSGVAGNLVEGYETNATFGTTMGVKVIPAQRGNFGLPINNTIRKTEYFGGGNSFILADKLRAARLKYF